MKPLIIKITDEAVITSLMERVANVKTLNIIESRVKELTGVAKSHDRLVEGLTHDSFHLNKFSKEEIGEILTKEFLKQVG